MVWDLHGVPENPHNVLRVNFCVRCSARITVYTTLGLHLLAAKKSAVGTREDRQSVHIDHLLEIMYRKLWSRD